jgi:hypothetical protein
MWELRSVQIRPVTHLSKLGCMVQVKTPPNGRKRITSHAALGVVSPGGDVEGE